MICAISSPLHPNPLILPSTISKWTNPRLPPTLSSHQRFLTRALNLPAENPSDPSTTLDRIISSAHKVLDDLPQPVKSFPWARSLESFFRLVFDLSFTICKYLSAPVLAVSSLSEMSYCGHERKLVLVPLPFIFGFAVCTVLSDIATDLSICSKEGEGEIPWHLLLVAAFFLMLKLPGPYYPYWGRLLVPHFANGGLWRTVWLGFMWYRGVAGRRIHSTSYDHDGSS